jgi:hypothetical protein
MPSPVVHFEVIGGERNTLQRRPGEDGNDVGREVSTAPAPN